MATRRSFALLVLGILIGSLATALVFSFFYKNMPQTEEQQDSETEIAKRTEVEQTSTPDFETDHQTERNIKGNCFFFGSVLDSEGNGIENALVRLRLLDEPWSTADIPVKTYTDDSGRFRIDGLNERLTYQLWAWAKGHAAASHNRIPCGTEIDLVLDEGATFNLSFKDPAGKQIGPVEVQLTGAVLWPARHGYTDSNGALTITGLEAGEYMIWANIDNLAYVSDDPIQIAKGKVTRATLELTWKIPSATEQIQTDPYKLPSGIDNSIQRDRGSTIRGTVLDVNGDPIKDASILVYQELGKSLVALPTGRGRRFHRRLLDAALSGWPRLYRTKDGSRIPGPRHIPLPRIEDGALKDSQEKVNRAAWQLTDNDGQFLINGLPSGRISLQAGHPDFVIVKPIEITIEPQSNKEGVIIVMRPGSEAVVRTLNEQGYPVGEAELTVYDMQDTKVASGVTGRDGYATLMGLPGSFRIESTALGRVPAVIKVKGKSGKKADLEMTLPLADKALSGRVTNENGFGIAEAAIVARTVTKGLIQVLTCQTEDDGTFSLLGAGGGRYHVTANAAKQGRAQVIDADYEEEIKLVLGGDREMTAQGFFETEAIKKTTFEPNGLSLPSPPDNLGTTGETLETSSENSFHTRFGQVDQLEVTGPPPGKGGLPITLGGGIDRVIVKSIRPGSRVANAGLSKGDRIIAIDNKKVTGPTSARQAIKGPIGSVVMLKVDSNGELFTVVVQRVRVRSE